MSTDTNVFDQGIDYKPSAGYPPLPSVRALVMSASMKSAGANKYVTITEAAKVLRISRAAVHRAVKQGRLEAERGHIIKIIRKNITGWKISRSSLNAYRVSLLHQWVGKKIA